METVMKNFVVYRYTEIAFILFGVALFFLFQKEPNGKFWSGLGVGLFIMAVFALGTDYFAEKRGRVYLKGLKEFVKDKG